MSLDDKEEWAVEDALAGHEQNRVIHIVTAETGLSVCYLKCGHAFTCQQGAWTVGMVANCRYHCMEVIEF